jgi:hypothetical protein
VMVLSSIACQHKQEARRLAAVDLLGFSRADEHTAFKPGLEQALPD